MSYTVKKIENNIYNHYKYHYLDHITSIIDIRENYWSFAIDLYSINNFHLPINSLAGDMQLPYQRVQDIAFNLNSDQSKAKEGVEHNKNYSHIYSGAFNLDTSQNELFKQDLQNIKLNFSLNLFIDPEAAKGAGSDVSQDDLDNLINETSEQRWDFELYYTNTHTINKSAVVENIVSYSLLSGNECIATFNDANIYSSNYDLSTQSIIELTTITSKRPFQILSGKIKFNYWIGLETKSKSIEKVIEVDHKTTNSIVINLNESTYFDFENNEVVFDPYGQEGFYIPKYSNGYYELELIFLQEGVINKLIINNVFSFIKNETKPIIGISHKLIENIDDFKEVIF